MVQFLRYLVVSILAFVAFSFSSFSVSAANLSTTSLLSRPETAVRLIQDNVDDDTAKKAQDLILEVYKLQGKKIIRDIDESLEKINPDPRVRVEAYSSIQKTLEFRKKKISQSELSESARDLIVNYIDYMVDILDQKKSSLTK